jgi:hypothetical protein
MAAKTKTIGRTILDDQVEAALEVWFEPNWLALVQLGARAAPAYGALVEDARKRMRRALIAARKAGPPIEV